ncbi:MAG: hypothetical protein JWP63_1403 [Candidatus Solibacter sp.]|nr:hypothetical protein [Candidatus Solibacter sp.]
MLLHFGGGARRKLGDVGLHALALRGEGEALEKVGRLGGIGAIGKSQALGAADEREGLLAAAIAEEMIEADIEKHGDAREGGEGRHELAVLELREHGGGESRVLAEIDERDFLAQAALAEPAANLVRGEDAADGLLAAFGVFHAHISGTKINGLYFIATECIFVHHLNISPIPC